jgi:biopolymer transport protein ExbD
MKGAFDDQLMGEINMTPLVDVMLVLLVVFMLTVPALMQAVPLELPQVTSQAKVPKSDPVVISITANGEIFWNGVTQSSVQLQASMHHAARLPSQPEIQIQADKRVAYDYVMQVMAASHNAGLRHLSFINETQR